MTPLFIIGGGAGCQKATSCCGAGGWERLFQRVVDHALCWARLNHYRVTSVSLLVLAAGDPELPPCR